MKNRIIATTIKAIRWQVLPQNLKIFYDSFGVKLFTYLGFVITTICTCLHLFDLESKLYTDLLLVLFIFSLLYLFFILKKNLLALWFLVFFLMENKKFITILVDKFLIFMIPICFYHTSSYLKCYLSERIKSRSHFYVEKNFWLHLS